MRDSRGRFTPGQSGNPGGRPSRKPLTDLLVAALDRTVGSGDTTAAELIVRKLVSRARAGDRWAVELLFDRVEGRPVASLDAHISRDALAVDDGAYARVAAKLNRLAALTANDPGDES